MAIGRITGQMLFPNLERQGVDLQVDTDLTYFDVTTRRLGVNTISPQYTLDVRGNARLANLTILGNTITSDTGKVGLGTAANVVITGGSSYDVLYTDGNGNLAFGNLNVLATQDFFTGDHIALGTNTAGQLASNAITFLSTTSVTNAIAKINSLLGNISNPTGSTLTTGNLFITSGVPSTNYQTGAVQVEGGVGIHGNLYVSGNINAVNGNVTILNSAFIVGNATTGFGAIYAGIPTGYTVLPQLVAQFSSNYNGYAQVNNQNISDGTSASTDFVATANDGNDSQYYVDVGINSSTFNNPVYSGYGPHDSYLLADGGNLILNVEDSTKTLKFLVGGYTADKLSAQMFGPNTVSTNSSSGTFVVYGDQGITGNLQIGSNLYSNSASFGSINNTPIGNATPATGTFTYLTATVGFSTANASISGGNLTALTDVYSGVGNFNNLSSGNVLLTGGKITGITEFTATYGNITNLTTANIVSTGNITSTGNTTANYYFGNGSQMSGVSAPITVSEYLYGDLANVIPHVSTLRFDRSTGFTVQDLGANTALISMSSSFKTWVVPGQANLVAYGEDTVRFDSDNNIVLTTHSTADPIKSIKFAIADNFVTGNITANGSITGTLATANQPNITNVGTLSNLTVSGNIRGNVTAPNASLGNIVISGHTISSNLTDIVFGSASQSAAFNMTGAVALPSGTSSQRPASLVAGQLRWNTESETIEWFNGLAWQNFTTSLEYQAFNGDGTTVSFPLDFPATQTSIMVNINGTTQFPGLAYTVSAQNIVFSEAPLLTDRVDIRFLATPMADVLGGGGGGGGSGDSLYGVNHSLYLGNVYIGTTTTLIDCLPVTGNNTVKWSTSSKDTVNLRYKSAQIDSINDATTIYYNEYGVLKSNASANVVTFTSNISNGNINLWATGDSANVLIAFERLTLGSSTHTGYLNAGINDTFAGLYQPPQALDQNADVHFGSVQTSGNITVNNSPVITLSTLKSVAAASTSFADFQARISNL